MVLFSVVVRNAMQCSLVIWSWSWYSIETENFPGEAYAFVINTQCNIAALKPERVSTF